ncbi:MAG: exodeoxyribonuclease VII large subunit [Pseudomonadota bacterium]
MAQPSETNAAEFSVSEIAFAVKRVVEDSFGYVRVRGEVSGFRGPAASGHCYFALKDEKARIDSVIWRGTYQKLKVKPEEGLEVIATGRLTTYPGSSKYQIVVDSLEPAGIGALMALLEARKKQLAAEGLFDEDRKRPLPFAPKVIGVVTSPTGAVIRDIVHRLEDRFPVHVVVWPVRVQGETSASEVAAAIDGFNGVEPGGPVPRPDLLIVARGGGSIEDLWSFNEEIVARAAARSEIPLVSAVGHETDWTLIDFVADLRAPTPTGAAEMAVPVRSELMASADDFGRRLENAGQRRIETAKTALRALERALPGLHDLIALPRQRLDAASERLGRALVSSVALHRSRYQAVSARMTLGAVGRGLDRASERLDGLGARLRRAWSSDMINQRERFLNLDKRLDPRLVTRPIAEARRAGLDLGRRLAELTGRAAADRRRVLDATAKLLDAYSYDSVLKRGFAIVRNAEGRIVRSVRSVKAGDGLALALSDGTIDVVAGPIRTEGSVNDEKVAKPRRKKVASPPEGQGSLF